MTLREEQERAHRLATSVVSAAIAVVGVTLVLFAVLLLVRGGIGFLFLSVILLVVGLGVALLALFFQLVPFRLAELAAMKRQRDESRHAREPRPPP